MRHRLMSYGSQGAPDSSPRLDEVDGGNLPWGEIRRGSHRFACVQATVPISPRCCRQPGKQQRAYRPNTGRRVAPITAAAVRDRRYMNANVADVMDSSPQMGAGEAHRRGSEGMAMSGRRTTLLRTLSASVATGLLLAGCSASDTSGGTQTPPTTPTVAAATASQTVGRQYDTVHVYVHPGQFDNFVHSWTATFGGTTSAAVVTDVTPTRSQTRSQLGFKPLGQDRYVDPSGAVASSAIPSTNSGRTAWKCTSVVDVV
jgi:hypothetical protein